MAYKVRLTTGFYAVRCNDKEINETWDLMNKNVSPVGKDYLFTPNDNLKYFIESESDSGGKIESIIIANNKRFKVKSDICNLDSKILKGVRNAYKM